MFSCCPTQLRNRLSTKKCSSGLWWSEKESWFLFLSLSWSVESTALRLITALGSSEVQPQFTRFLNDPKTVLSAESEELNRALILTLARATHVTGTHSVFKDSFAVLFFCLFFCCPLYFSYCFAFCFTSNHRVWLKSVSCYLSPAFCMCRFFHRVWLHPGHLV